MIILSDLENCKGFKSTSMSNQCENHSVHEGRAVLGLEVRTICFRFNPISGYPFFERMRKRNSKLLIIIMSVQILSVILTCIQSSWKTLPSRFYKLWRNQEENVFQDPIWVAQR